MKTLANDIKNKSFKNAYLLCGEEEYLKLNYKNRLIKSIAGDDTMNLGMYEGKNIDINEVIDSAETVPFFAELLWKIPVFSKVAGSSLPSI